MIREQVVKKALEALYGGRPSPSVYKDLELYIQDKITSKQLISRTRDKAGMGIRVEDLLVTRKVIEYENEA